MFEVIETVQTSFPLLLAQDAAVPSGAPVQWINRLDNEEIFVLMLVSMGIGAAVLITAITAFAKLVETIRISSARSKMMQQLLDRGYSPSEIHGLVELIGRPASASTPTPTPDKPAAFRHDFGDVPPAKPVAANAH